MSEAVAVPATSTAAVPILRRLAIERFRGVQPLTWYPSPGFNIGLGGRDAVKTTLLETIGLLLSPISTTVGSDTDYWQRQYEADFQMEAIFALPVGSGSVENSTRRGLGNGMAKTRRSQTHQGSEPFTDMAYRAGFAAPRTWSSFISYCNVSSFSVGLRRSIGLVRLSGEDRSLVR